MRNHEKEWVTFKFSTPHLDYQIPSDLMIKESLVMPVLDRDFACRILSRHEIKDRTQLDEIISRNSPNLWDEIIEELSSAIDTNYCPKLYAYFSLQKHRISPQPDDPESFSEFIRWSNGAVEIMENYPEDPFLKTFCDNQFDIPHLYDSWRYHQDIISYCAAIFPRPLHYNQTNRLDYEMKPSIIKEHNEIAEGTRDWFTPVPTRKNPDEFGEDFKRRQRSAAYIEQNRESGNRQIIRFSELENSRTWARAFVERYGGELNDFRELNQKRILAEIKQDKSNQQKRLRSTKKEKTKQTTIETIQSIGEHHKLLYQCQFCYRYRTDDPKRIPAWYCGGKKSKCGKAYQDWIDDLKSERRTKKSTKMKIIKKKVVRIEDLRLMGW
jgi:hypothetical protein